MRQEPAVIALIKQLWRMMQGDKSATSFNRANKKKVILILHYTFLLLFLSLSQPPPPTPSLQHDGQSIARQSALWCCSHLHRAKKKEKKKNLRQDMMTYPGGVFHCSLGLMGEGSQPRYVCVCTSAYSIWWCVYPRPCAVLLWCWVSPCSGLSPAARETSCETDRFVFCTHLHSFFPCRHTRTHTHMQPHTHNEAHTQTHTQFHGLRFKYTCTHKPPHPTPTPPTSTHIQRPSHKLQAVSLMPATNTVQKEYAYRARIYGGYS